jgi:predicted molibdopterin-dependent oxidoreductase YjgC
LYPGCNETVNEILDFSNRGSRAKVGPSFDTDYNESNVLQGECVDACRWGPSLQASPLQGRPWETTKVKTTCTYCGVGCQMDLHVFDGKIIKVTGNRDYGQPNLGSLCAKGRFGLDFISHPSRLKTPLIRRTKGGELEEASWDEALDFVAQKLTAIKAENGADSIAGLASARCTNEEN